MSKTLVPLTVAALLSGSAAAEPTPAQAVDALNGVFGVHAGARASHAKGVCFRGSFAPNANAAAITTAAHLQKSVSSVVGRFSVGGGNPKASDKAKSVRGLALRFTSSDGSSTDLVMISAPVFFVGHADNFVPYLEARRPDPATGKPDPAKVKAYNDTHADSKPQIDYLNAAPVPASYGQTAYWAVNAFKFTDAKAQTVHGRWRAEPVAGRLGLTAEQLTTLPDDFLRAELQTRLAAAPVEFDLWIQVAEPGDIVDDPTIQWSEQRRQIKAGRLRLATFDGDACDGVMFNPNALPDGIAASDDSTLKARLPAYIESLRRRQTKPEGSSASTPK